MATTVVRTRALALAGYRDYLEAHPALKAAARVELRGKDLVCWCAPLPCHADILLELANEGQWCNDVEYY